MVTASDDVGRTVISYGSEASDTEATPGDTGTVVTSYDGDPGVTSYAEAGQLPWGHHGPGPGPRDTYNALLRTQGPSSSGHSGLSPRVKLNPLFHQYS